MTSGPFVASTGLNRVYKRDKDGKFASTGGVRQSLADAKTTTAISAAAYAEAKRITGRGIAFDLTGSDLQTAREHAEGILQGLERFPKARLARVDVGDTGTAWAHADGAHIRFSSAYSSAAGRKKYLKGLAEGAAGWDKGLQVYGISDLKVASYHTRNSGSPTAVALHEMGHVVAIATTSQRSYPAVDAYVRKATAQEQRSQTLPGVKIKDSGDLVLRTVSGYAMTNRHELVAEAFTDVMVNGPGASTVSRGIFDILEREYQAS